MTLQPLPDPRFIGWFRWSALHDGSVDDEVRAALRCVGTYLVAHFPSAPPQAVDRTDASIFYIGETHGPTRSLRARLLDFGKSAGFLGAQRAGHYAAWAFPEFSRQNAIEANDVYVAICPYLGENTNEPADARGVFPTLVEAITLWSYTLRHGGMPALNNSGKQKASEPTPTWNSADVSSLLVDPEPYPAAEKLLAAIAETRGYAHRAFKHWMLDGWTGTERPFGGGYWASIGWRGVGREIGMWLTNGKSYRFDSEERSATNEVELRALLDEFWRHV